MQPITQVICSDWFFWFWSLTTLITENSYAKQHTRESTRQRAASSSSSSSSSIRLVSTWNAHLVTQDSASEQHWPTLGANSEHDILVKEQPWANNWHFKHTKSIWCSVQCNIQIPHAHWATRGTPLHTQQNLQQRCGKGTIFIQMELMKKSPSAYCYCYISNLQLKPWRRRNTFGDTQMVFVKEFFNTTPWFMCMFRMTILNHAAHTLSWLTAPSYLMGWGEQQQS